MNRKTQDELILCSSVNKKLRTGEPISDEELSAARKHFLKTEKFLAALQDRRYDLFLQQIRDDLVRLNGYHIARKRKIT